MPASSLRFALLVSLLCALVFGPASAPPASAAGGPATPLSGPVFRPDSSYPGAFAVAGDQLYFTATNYGSASAIPTTGLWKSDGTEAGTFRLKDINPSGSSGAAFFTVAGSRLFFQANDGAHGLELWVTDGTAAGTQLVKDINPGGAGSSPDQFVDVNGVLFFRADDGVHGRELWKSDGTPEGTQLVTDLEPGAASSGLNGLRATGGRLCFDAQAGASGIQLWVSDGLPGGTLLVQDIQPGWSVPLGATADRLFFAASDETGSRLWAVPLTAATPHRVYLPLVRR